MLALRNCINDHKSYIKSYIDETQKCMARNTKKYMKYKKELRLLLRDVTIMYPQLTASLMTNTPIVGGGEKLQVTKQFIESTQRIYDKFKQIEPDKIAAKATEIQKSLETLGNMFSTIEHRLNAPDTPHPEQHVDLTLVGLVETQESLNQFIDGTSKPIIKQLFRRNPTDFVPSDTHTIRDMYVKIAGDILNSLQVESQIANVIVAIVKSTTKEELAESLQTDAPFVANILAELKTQKELHKIKTEYLDIICSTISTKQINMNTITELQKSYSEQKQTINEHLAKLDNIIIELNSANEVAINLINGNEEYDVSQLLFHTVPSVKHLGLMLHNYIIVGTEDTIKHICSDIYESYKLTSLGALIEQLINNTTSVQNLSIENQNLFIEKFNENDAQEMGHFLKNMEMQINNHDNPEQLCQKITAAMTNTYKNMYYKREITENIAKHAICIESGILYIQPLLYSNLPYPDGMDDDGNWENTFNKKIVQIKYALLAKQGLPSCICAFPQHPFRNIYTKTIYNVIFDDSPDDLKNRHSILDTNIGKMGNMLYNPNFATMKQQAVSGGGKRETAEAIKLLLEICSTSTQFTIKLNEIAKLGHNYNEYYAHIYNYIRLLILIATNQIFSSKYVTYIYFNKSLIEYYHRNLTKIVEGLQYPDSIALHFIKDNYFIIMKKLHTFFGKLSTTVVDRTSVIDIRGITNPIFKMYFLLLNNIKNVIDSFVEMSQYRVSIYARINDKSAGKLKIFKSDYEHSSGNKDPTKMHIDIKSCKIKQHHDAIPPVHFTEVFDSIYFLDNGDISKYMILPAQLAKRKGVCIITYGYSGTGKTFTLFGNSERQGILQSTLANINGLRNVKIRLFEIYGRGFSSYVYWEKGQENIYQVIYEYKLHILDGIITFDNTQVNEHLPINGGFSKFVTDNDTYLQIDETIVDDVFSNFSRLINNVDTHRQTNKRIINTANNPVSSRSILVYEFKLYVGGETEDDAVTFLVVDLPGRENIINTFVDPYIAKMELQQQQPRKMQQSQVGLQVQLQQQNEKVRMILTCMALNPMALSIFAMPIIRQTIYTNNAMYDLWEKIKPIKVNNVWTIGDVVSIDSQLTLLPIRDSVPLMFPQSEETNISSDASGFRRLLGYSGTIHSVEYAEQMWQIVITFMIYQLMIDNNFELIENIYKAILTEYSCDDYEYLIPPFEGIYINENIIGLMKYLADVVISDGKKATIAATSEQHMKQKNVSLVEMRNMIRAWITTDSSIWNVSHDKHDRLFNALDLTTDEYVKNYISEPKLPSSNRYYSMQRVVSTPTKKLEIDYEQMIKCQRDLVRSYVPSKIYNYKKPLIQDILSPYMVQSENTKTKYISDFKVFYLFGNFDEIYTQQRCGDQIDLFMDSKDIIDAFTT